MCSGGVCTAVSPCKEDDIHEKIRKACISDSETKANSRRVRSAFNEESQDKTSSGLNEAIVSATKSRISRIALPDKTDSCKCEYVELHPEYPIAREA